MPEPAFPARSRIPAITGAAVRVLIVVANGDRPLRSTCLPAILVCPKLAPCLACPYTGRSSESMSMNAWLSIPASRSVRSASPTRCARATEASCAQWPWVNSRRNCPNVAGAYTCSNNRVIPPERITCRSSMLSAPAAIPAMIELSFPAGFTPADATRVSPSATRSATSSDSPACSANAITGTSPTYDTRSSSSNSGVALDHACDRFTSSAFSVSSDQDLNTPDSPAQKALPRQPRRSSTDESDHSTD